MRVFFAMFVSCAACVGPVGELLAPPLDAVDDAGAGSDAGASEEPRDASSPDARGRDAAFVRDAGRADSGTAHDTGVRDTGVLDACVPEIEATPEIISFHNTPSEAPLTIRNLGCDALDITQVHITEVGGTGTVPDFQVNNCVDPCTEYLRICQTISLACPRDAATFMIRYNNRDLSAFDDAEVHIVSNDPRRGDRVVRLEAR